MRAALSWVRVRGAQAPPITQGGELGREGLWWSGFPADTAEGPREGTLREERGRAEQPSCEGPPPSLTGAPHLLQSLPLKVSLHESSQALLLKYSSSPASPSAESSRGCPLPSRQSPCSVAWHLRPFRMDRICCPPPGLSRLKPPHTSATYSLWDFAHAIPSTWQTFFSSHVPGKCQQIFQASSPGRSFSDSLKEL